MMQKPSMPPDLIRRPKGNQFTLRGMFLLVTALCVIFALLGALVKSPAHWLGMAVVPLFCLLVIGVIELSHRCFPPPPWEWRYENWSSLPPGVRQPGESHLPPINELLGTTPFLSNVNDSVVIAAAVDCESDKREVIEQNAPANLDPPAPSEG